MGTVQFLQPQGTETISAIPEMLGLNCHLNPGILSVFQARRMLKKSASGVLASLRGSTYQSVRLTSLLAAALPDSLFEHPAGDPTPSTYLYTSGPCRAKKLSFSANC
jgi:hypothetical protein